VSSGADAVGWSCSLRGGGYNGIYFRIAFPPRYSGVEIVPTKDYSGIVSDGQWHHFAAVRSSGNITLYLDGDIIGSRLCDKDVNNSAPLCIGTIEPRGVAKLDASLDEFRVWNRALSQAEIKASYDSKINPLSVTFTGLADGTYRYYAYVVDSYGNSAQTEPRELSIRLPIPK
jgi:hypothetical protein